MISRPGYMTRAHDSRGIWVKTGSFTPALPARWAAALSVRPSPTRRLLRGSRAIQYPGLPFSLMALVR